MRVAADELRAELAGDRVTFVVNRNINFTNICVVGCAFCGFGQGKRSPDAYEVSEEDFAARIEEAVEFGATELCMQGGIHPDLTLEEYGKWLRLAKDVAPQLHLHAYSPMEVHYMCERSGKGPDEVFEYLLECGLGSTPGTAAEVLDDGVRQRISPNKLPADRWVEIIEASHRAGLRSTSTVMFGHIEEPRELARHMRVVRALQERTGGITEFVPLSFIPFNTMLGRTHGIEEISMAENLKHTAAFRLALGRTIPNLQASWVKMGLERRDRGAALGRQRPRRHADGGEHLAHGGLPARRPAGARAADRGGPRRRPRARPAHDALRDSRDLLDQPAIVGRSLRGRQLARGGFRGWRSSRCSALAYRARRRGAAGCGRGRRLGSAQNIELAGPGARRRRAVEAAVSDAAALGAGGNVAVSRRVVAGQFDASLRHRRSVRRATRRQRRRSTVAAGTGRCGWSQCRGRPSLNRRGRATRPPLSEQQMAEAPPEAASSPASTPVPAARPWRARQARLLGVVGR